MRIFAPLSLGLSVASASTDAQSSSPFSALVAVLSADDLKAKLRADSSAIITSYKEGAVRAITQYGDSMAKEFLSSVNPLLNRITDHLEAVNTFVAGQVDKKPQDMIALSEADKESFSSFPFTRPFVAEDYAQIMADLNAAVDKSLETIASTTKSASGQSLTLAFSFRPSPSFLSVQVGSADTTETQKEETSGGAVDLAFFMKESDMRQLVLLNMDAAIDSVDKFEAKLKEQLDTFMGALLKIGEDDLAEIVRTALGHEAEIEAALEAAQISNLTKSRSGVLTQWGAAKALMGDQRNFSPLRKCATDLSLIISQQSPMNPSLTSINSSCKSTEL